MTPPFKTPSKASYFFSGFHSATTPPLFGKLRMCNPSGFAGPQPQQALFGAYFSCRDCDSFIVAALYERRKSCKLGGHRPPLQIIRRVQTSLDRDAIRVQRKVSADE